MDPARDWFAEQVLASVERRDGRGRERWGAETYKMVINGAPGLQNGGSTGVRGSVAQTGTMRPTSRGKERTSDGLNLFHGVFRWASPAGIGSRPRSRPSRVGAAAIEWKTSRLDRRNIRNEPKWEPWTPKCWSLRPGATGGPSQTRRGSVNIVVIRTLDGDGVRDGDGAGPCATKTPRECVRDGGAEGAAWAGRHVGEPGHQPMQPGVLPRWLWEA